MPKGFWEYLISSIMCDIQFIKKITTKSNFKTFILNENNTVWIFEHLNICIG